MARHPQPRHITLGGREAVALTLEEYEQLIASRRQIGGQSARVRVLAQQAKRTEQLLRELETLIAAAEHGSVDGCTCPAPGPAVEETAAEADPKCLRCALAALLRRHREPSA